MATIREMIEAERRKAFAAARDGLTDDQVRAALALLSDERTGKLPIGFGHGSLPYKGQARIMAYAEGYAMLRNKGAMPFVLSVKDVRETLLALLSGEV